MSLYNMERPMTLSEVKGQQQIKSQLYGMFQSGNVPNALLLVGPRGTGKTTIARIVAKKVNCDCEGNEPCNACDSCKAIMSGISPDVIELDAASNNSVDDVEKVVAQVQYAAQGKVKVFILDEVHMFSNAAWNSLLKTLEEPPKNVLFILCTTEEAKIPATIISRCRKCYFEKIALTEVVEALKAICDKHGKAYEEGALVLIAKASDGCMRDALSIMEGFFDDRLTAGAATRALGACPEDAIFDILSAIQARGELLALEHFRYALNRGASLQGIVKGLIEAVTDTLYVLQGADVSSILNTEAYKTRLSEFSKQTNADTCIEFAHRLSDVYFALTKSSDAMFMVESAIVGMIGYESELQALKERIKALESNPVAVSQPAVAVETPVITEAPAPVVEATEEVLAEEDDDEIVLNEGFTPWFDDIPALSDDETIEGFSSVPAKMDPFAEEEDDVFDHLPEGTVLQEETMSLFDNEVPFEEDAAPLPVEPAREPEVLDSGLSRVLGNQLANDLMYGLGDLSFFQDLMETF